MKPYYVSFIPSSIFYGLKILNILEQSFCSKSKILKKIEGYPITNSKTLSKALISKSLNV